MTSARPRIPRRTGDSKTLDRALSRLGCASRVAARKLIAAGQVRVNGRIELRDDRWVDLASDRIEVRGRSIRAPAPFRLVLYNKPQGVIVTLRQPSQPNDLTNHLSRPFGDDPSLRPVGRLDQASAGLLLLTNDMRFADRLLRHEHGVAKEYRVSVAPAVTLVQLEQLRNGLDIGDARPTLPARVRQERVHRGSSVLRIELIEGRNRQIRRMVRAIGAEVKWLVRIRIGPVSLGNLAPGSAREATLAERRAVLAAAGARFAGDSGPKSAQEPKT